MKNRVSLTCTVRTPFLIVMLSSFFTAQLLSKHMNPVGIQGVIPGRRVQNDLKHHGISHATTPSIFPALGLSAKALLVEPAECSPDHTEP